MQTPPETTENNPSLDAQIAQIAPHTDPISEHNRAAMEHQRQVTQLGAQINAKALINARLSQEMLAEIFFQYVLICNADRRRLVGDSRMYQWVAAVTLVCRYWREVATSFPQIWSFIDIYHISLTGIKELLARSKDAPLQVYAIYRLSMLAPSWGELNVVLQALPRIQNLTIKFPHPENDVPLSQMTWRDLPAPLLKSITYIGHWQPHENASSNASILHHLLRRNLPRLKRLELDYLPFIWISLKLPPSLTTLIVTLDSISSLPLYPVADVLAVLAKLPLLERLDLNESLLTDSENTPSPEEHMLPNITLLRLKRLRIRSTARRRDLYMKHLTYPSHTKLHDYILAMADLRGPNLDFTLANPMVTAELLREHAQIMHHDITERLNDIQEQLACLQ